MNAIGIGPDGASGLSVYSVVALHGSGAAAPFKGCYFEQPGGKGRVIEEALNVQLEGTSAEIDAGLASLERIFQLARENQSKKVGYPMYLLVQPLSGGETWRSQLLDGWVEKRSGSVQQGSLVARLRVQRLNYWEGSERLVPLSNLHGTEVSELLQVYNHTDGGHANYAEIARDALEGDLPAACRLQMNGAHGSLTGFVGSVMVALNANLHPDSPIDHFLDSDEAAGGTSVSDAGCSNGSYRLVTWSGSAETTLLYWTLSATQMGLGDGRYYRPVMRVYPLTAYTDLWVRLVMQLGTTVIWEGPWQLLTAGMGLQELSTVQLPPYLINQNNLLPLFLLLKGKRTAGGSPALGIDYVQLSPLDGWRKLVTRGQGVQADGTLEDDGFQDYIYVNTAGEYKTDYLTYGEPLRLYPGRLQRLYFLMMNRDTGDAEALRGFTLRLYYRPRKRRI